MFQKPGGSKGQGLKGQGFNKQGFQGPGFPGHEFQGLGVPEQGVWFPAPVCSKDQISDNICMTLMMRVKISYFFESSYL